MKKVKKILLYNYIIPPRRIKLRSKVMNLDYEIDQSDWDKSNEYKPVLGIDDLFVLKETNLFEQILMLSDPCMLLQYRLEGMQEFKEINNGWVDITKFVREDQS